MELVAEVVLLKTKGSISGVEYPQDDKFFGRRKWSWEYLGCCFPESHSYGLLLISSRDSDGVGHVS